MASQALIVLLLFLVTSSHGFHLKSTYSAQLTSSPSSSPPSSLYPSSSPPSSYPSSLQAPSHHPKSYVTFQESLKAPAFTTCASTYNFLPCTHSLLGNLFLMLAYGYIVYRAAKLLSEGSELLLAVWGPGIIGGLILPLFGVLPDALLVLVSGLGSDKADAQKEVLVGVGLLAGSIVMLLTLLWGFCLIRGRCDLQRTEDGKIIAIDKQRTKKFCDLTETGVQTDHLTKVSARIMVASVIPYLVAQLQRVVHSSFRNVLVLVACAISFSGMAAYCIYQVLNPKIQERRRYRALRLASRLLALEKVMRYSERMGDTLFDMKGNINEVYAKRVFTMVDEDRDGKISERELAMLLNLTVTDYPDVVRNVMEALDYDRSQGITIEEFLNGLAILQKDLKTYTLAALEKKWEKVDKRIDKLLDVAREEEPDDEDIKPPSRAQVIRKSVLLLVTGAAMAAFAAEPLVDAVEEFSAAIHIPAFFVSFIILPLASNSSEAVSSIIFSGRRDKLSMSLTYSQIYGAVTLNSTIGLGIFLALVYGRGLVWNFSAEVLVICFVIIFMGLLTSFRSTFPTWMALIVLILYPISLGLVAILDYVAHWK